MHLISIAAIKVNKSNGIYLKRIFVFITIKQNKKQRIDTLKDIIELYYEMI